MNNAKTIKQWGWGDIFKDPYFYITLVISATIVVIGDEGILRSVMVDLGIAMAGVSSALLGIVIAGLAIFLAFMDKKYIALIDEIFGIGNELFPIKVTTILAIICLLFSLALIRLGSHMVETRFRGRPDR